MSDCWELCFSLAWLLQSFCLTGDAEPEGALKLCEAADDLVLASIIAFQIL